MLFLFLKLFLVALKFILWLFNKYVVDVVFIFKSILNIHEDYLNASYFQMWFELPEMINYV